LWSAISSGDLGLKAGYWTGKDDDPLTFRPIVGWVTAMTRKVPFTDADPPKNGFYAVVLADDMYPTPAGLLANYCGVFLKKTKEDLAKQLALEWMRKKPGSTELQPNMWAGQA